MKRCSSKLNYYKDYPKVLVTMEICMLVWNSSELENSIPAADSKSEYVLSYSHLFTKLKFKTKQKQLLQ